MSNCQNQSYIVTFLSFLRQRWCGVKSDFVLSRADWSSSLNKKTLTCDHRFCILVDVDDRRDPTEGCFPCVISPSVCLISSKVQQTPVCTHRTDKPLLQRRPVGVGGHSSDLWQIPRKERRPEGAVWERPPEFFLPHKVLGEFHQIWPLWRRRYRSIAV